MKRYTLKYSGPNLYLCCNDETIACFVRSNPTQQEDAEACRRALQHAADTEQAN